MEQVSEHNRSAQLSFASALAVCIGVLAIFWPTVRSMAGVWERSNTYGHCFLVFPAFVWMLWRSRFILASVPARPSWLALPLLAGAGLVWLGGDLAAAAQPSHFALVAMMPLAVAVVLGTSWVRALAFPFAFLFLSVPFGDSWIPVLMDWTANFTVAAIRSLGVSVYQEGTQFTLSSGIWTVVESCSGIRYLFACATLAALYAWSVYRSPAKRGLFVAGAVMVAIAANWVRAFTIVMLSHLTDQRVALEVDHVVYGWVFFAVVMTIVFALGELWRAREPEHAGPPASAIHDASSRAVPVPRQGIAAAATAVAAVLCVWPWLAQAGAGVSTQVPTIIRDIEPRAGWVRQDRPWSTWKPLVVRPLAERSETFAKDGERVGVHLALYGRPTSDSKLASSENRLVPRDFAEWRQVDQGLAHVRTDSTEASVRMATVVGPEERIIVWQLYWVDGAIVQSPLRALLAQMSARLLGRSETSALVTVFTSDRRPRSPLPDAVEPFLADMLEPISAALQSTAMAMTAAAPRAPEPPKSPVLD